MKLLLLFSLSLLELLQALLMSRVATSLMFAVAHDDQPYSAAAAALWQIEVLPTYLDSSFTQLIASCVSF